MEHISVSQRPLFKGLLGQQELVLCERGNPCNHFNSTVDFTGSDVKFSAVSVSLSHVSLAGISNGYCVLCDPALEASDWLFSCHPICVWEHAKQTFSGSLSSSCLGVCLWVLHPSMCVQVRFLVLREGSGQSWLAPTLILPVCKKQPLHTGFVLNGTAWFRDSGSSV